MTVETLTVGGALVQSSLFTTRASLYVIAPVAPTYSIAIITFELAVDPTLLRLLNNWLLNEWMNEFDWLLNNFYKINNLAHGFFTVKHNWNFKTDDSDQHPITKPAYADVQQ